MTLLLLFQPKFSLSATIPRAPFYVPRPSDDPVWGIPVGPLSSGAIELTTTQVKVFGQPGQAPTKAWTPYLYDDPAFWMGNPVASGVLPQLAHQFIYGQAGQVATNDWSAYVYDDPAIWKGSPTNSAAIPLLTQQVMFGKGGQVALQIWTDNYTFDDAAPWSGAPEALNYALSKTLGAVASPFTPYFWPLVDDAAPWEACPEGSAVIPLLTHQFVYGPGGQTPSPFWGDNYTLDDAAPWEASPEGSATIPLLTHQFVYGRGGQTATPFWGDNYVFDDAAPWSGAPVAYALRRPIVASPFTPHFWPVYLDDATVWNAVQLSPRTLVLTTTEPKIFGAPGQGVTKNWNAAYTLDDASFSNIWPQAMDAASFIPLASFATIDFAPANMRFDDPADEASFWAGAPNVGNLPARMVPQPFDTRRYVVRPPFYVPNPPRSDEWVGSPDGATLYVAGTIEDYAPANMRYDDPGDEAAFWAGAPNAGALSSRLVPPPFGLDGYMIRPPFYVPRNQEEMSWLVNFPLTRKLILPQSPPTMPQRFWPFLQDDAAGWNASPRNSLAIRTTAAQTKMYGAFGQAPTRNWNSASTLDEAALWSGSPLASATSAILSKILVQARQWPFGYDDAAPWVGQPVAIPAMQVILSNLHLFGVGGQGLTKLWQLSYSQDDPPGFRGNSNRPNTVTTFLTLPSNLEPTWQLFFAADEPWMLQPSRNTQIGAVVQTPFGLRQPPFHADDSYGWSGGPLLVPPGILSSVIVFVPSANAEAWPFGYDDASPWAPPPNMVNFSTPLAPLLTAGGIIRPRPWLWGLDDPAPWLGSPLSSLMVDDLLTSVGLVTPRQWTWGADDPAAWSGAPLLSGLLLPILTAGGQPPTKSWRYDQDDAVAWATRTPQPQLIPLPPPPPLNVRSTLVFSGYDDATVWGGGFRSVEITVTAVPFAPEQPVHLDIPDDQPWTLTYPQPTARLPLYKNFFGFGGLWTLHIPHDTPPVMAPQASAAITTPQLLPIRIALPPSGSTTAPTNQNVATAPSEQRSGTAPKKDI